MGIPSFYRWVSDRYPQSVVNVVEDIPSYVNGVLVPVDVSRPNPNEIEFDNLYLDMNGIIHPCFHPEGKPAPKSYDEVFKAIFRYIDRIFTMIRPRKLLYMAIDGVAPRAKMNQQRSRRFRAAKDAADVAAEAEKLRNNFESHEKKLEDLELIENLDSNIITPGTEFMATLSSALQYYIHLRLNRDPGWQSVKVILSDASVPGEGEHKIMSYIRLQRNLPGFDPNTCHCLYGLDVRAVQSNRKFNKGARITSECKGENVLMNEMIDDAPRQPFQFLKIWILREYLEHDLIPSKAVKADLERLIDDFVFMCLLVGNDFLPHIPSLEISEGAIDLLMAVYKKEFVQMGGYLTNSFEVDLGRVEHFILEVGSYEDAIFRRRGQTDLNSQNFNSGFSLALSNDTVSGNGVVDQIRLGEEGWKERYYSEKFDVMTEEDREKIKRSAVLHYVEGMCWVMQYYYQGVCSWQWFYPYHYAPFASDFRGLSQLEICFIQGNPFKPFDQLMGVLPAARSLMRDSASPIADFYPTDVYSSHQAVCKLPFIEESRLLAEIKKVEHTLTDEEKQRNSSSMDVLFVHISIPLATKICSFYEQNKDHPKLSKVKVKKRIDPRISDGMSGYIYLSKKNICLPEVHSPIGDMGSITKNQVISVFYKCPSCHTHIPRPPEGVNPHGKVISKKDVLPQPILFHERSAVRGRVFSQRPVHKSISGPFLAKLSHKLVQKFYTEKKLVTNGDKETRHQANKPSPDKEETLEKKQKTCNASHENGMLGKRRQRDPDQETEKPSFDTRETVKEKHMNYKTSCKDGVLGKRRQWYAKPNHVNNKRQRTNPFDDFDVGVVQAAWTRRSRGEAAKRPSRKSWKQRTDMYMRPFLLNVFFSKRYVHAKVVHRGTSKVVSVASTNAKDLRNTLPSLIDVDACRTIGRLIAERSKEADVFAVSFEPRKDERVEGRLGIVIDTIKENGIIFVD
ncbi:5'-3' exoribonuclease 4 [Acorus gramineus]|uniref:5'-3' exoribonuclease n=1 Tax=Acorus gramineus TaxID=55184 RepID=A0AAV9BC26_ACOGR|nr:5'-3' exoribonuclease 4 [Acorus gramineus]